MATNEAIAVAKSRFGTIVEQQLARVERLREEGNWTDFAAVNPIVIGMVGGDGIGPYISRDCEEVLCHLLAGHLGSGRVEIRTIHGLTIENRAALRQTVPDDVMDQIKKCHVTLKGPTHTPEPGDRWPSLESANVAIRRELDLFANVRPIRVPSEGIDWTFFRENTEDLYAVGSQGFEVTPDLALDFRVITRPGSERIIEAAFAHARRAGKTRVTVVTKANIIKATDGMFLKAARQVASRHPEIKWDAWYIDAMAAKLLDTKRRREFQVLVLPNLYGDILTDEAAEIQGGVGTAGSANIGKRYSMFEAIHGSAPRMVEEGRARYADPTSLLHAAQLLLEHTGFADEGRRLAQALDICTLYERRVQITGRGDGATSAEFTSYLKDTLDDPALDGRWTGYAAA